MAPFSRRPWLPLLLAAIFACSLEAEAQAAGRLQQTREQRLGRPRSLAGLAGRRALLAGAAAGAPSTAPELAPAPAPSEGGNLTEWQWDMLDLVNEARAKEGVGPLCYNALLIQVAQDHSQDQANMKKMTHDGSDGSTIESRPADAGYDWWWIGENVAYGFGDVVTLMQAWMNSPVHRANLLNPHFKQLGTGVATSDSTYWTQEFGDAPNQPCL